MENGPRILPENPPAAAVLSPGRPLPAEVSAAGGREASGPPAPAADGEEETAARPGRGKARHREGRTEKDGPAPERGRRRFSRRRAVGDSRGAAPRDFPRA